MFVMKVEIDDGKLVETIVNKEWKKLTYWKGHRQANYHAFFTSLGLGNIPRESGTT